MANKAKYDVFVSYRRTSFESASMIANALKAKGYRVFFDVENLRSGKFNEQLFGVIDKCTDFLLVLPENALDRCNDPEDWVRKEVLRAMQGRKNIIPVMLSGFSWPAVMPQGMEDLQMYQSLTASSREYFDLAMTRLSKSYLKSRHHNSKLLRTALSAVLIAAALSGAVYGALRIVSVPLANGIGSEMIGHMVKLDDISKCYADVYEKWNGFTEGLSSQGAMDNVLQSAKEMLRELESAEMFITETAPQDTSRMEISAFQSFALASRGLKSQDLTVEPEYVHQLVTECLDDIRGLERIIKEPDYSGLNLEMASLKYDMCRHLLYAFQYSNAEVFADMPRESRENFLLACRVLKFLPNDMPLTLTRDEYVRKQQAEMDKVHRCINDMQTVVEKGQTASDEMLEKEAGVNILFNAINDVIAAEQESAAVIAAKKEKIAAMKTTNNAQKAKLEEMDKEMVAAYEECVAKCTLEESDGKWHKWGKVCYFASFMEIMVESRTKMNSKGVRSTSSVTPEVLYANMASMLNAFKAYHPECGKMVESSKVFYHEVSKGKRPLKGVLVSGIRDDAAHPVFEPGDIILTMKGTEVASYDELKAAYKKEGAPAVTFLRLENGELAEHSAPDCGDVSNVAFNNLKDAD